MWHGGKKQDCEKNPAPNNIQSVLRGFGKQTWQQEQHWKDYHSIADWNKCWFLLLWASWVYPCQEYHTWLAHSLLQRGNDSNQGSQGPACAICNTKCHIQELLCRCVINMKNYFSSKIPLLKHLSSFSLCKYGVLLHYKPVQQKVVPKNPSSPLHSETNSSALSRSECLNSSWSQFLCTSLSMAEKERGSEW